MRGGVWWRQLCNAVKMHTIVAHVEPQRKDPPTLRDATANAVDVAVSASLERLMKRIMPRFEEFMEETTRY